LYFKALFDRTQTLAIVSTVWLIYVGFADAQTPSVTQQPLSQTVQVGDSAVFEVVATGADPLYYQWRSGVTNMPGASSNSLVLTNVTFAQAGNYYVVVSNSVGTTASDKANLTVVARELWGWGANDYDKATAPQGLDTVVAVAGGGVTSVALQADGTVTCWGLNGFLTPGFTNVPAGLSGVFSVSVGTYHSLTLTTNGNYVGWGYTEASEGAFTETWTNMVAASAGPLYCLGLRADGTVVAGGYEQSPVIPSGLDNITAVAAGGAFYLTLRGDGTVHAWDNSGNPANAPASLSNVVAVACGNAHGLALQVDGTVIAWGDNSAGQISTPFGLSNVVSIAAGKNHSLALLADGTVFAWGDNSYGQTNVPAYVTSGGGIGREAPSLSMAARWDRLAGQDE